MLPVPTLAKQPALAAQRGPRNELKFAGNEDAAVGSRPDQT
jgi:hypothetical protein